MVVCVCVCMRAWGCIYQFVCVWQKIAEDFLRTVHKGLKEWKDEMRWLLKCVRLCVCVCVRSFGVAFEGEIV